MIVVLYKEDSSKLGVVSMAYMIVPGKTFSKKVFMETVNRANQEVMPNTVLNLWCNHDTFEDICEMLEGKDELVIGRETKNRYRILDIMPTVEIGRPAVLFFSAVNKKVLPLAFTDLLNTK